MHKITVALLEDLDACASQLELFCKHYPQGVQRITVPTVFKALRLGLDVSWLVEILMEDTGKHDPQFYTLAQELERELYRACREINKEYHRRSDGIAFIPYLHERHRRWEEVDAWYVRETEPQRLVHYRKFAPVLAAKLRELLAQY